MLTLRYAAAVCTHHPPPVSTCLSLSCITTPALFCCPAGRTRRTPSGIRHQQGPGTLHCQPRAKHRLAQRANGYCGNSSSSVVAAANSTLIGCDSSASPACHDAAAQWPQLSKQQHLSQHHNRVRLSIATLLSVSDMRYKAETAVWHKPVTYCAYPCPLPMQVSEAGSKLMGLTVCLQLLVTVSSLKLFRFVVFFVLHAQAAEAASKLVGLTVDYVISSPFKRCLQTSAGLVRNLPGLQEGHWLVDWQLAEVGEFAISCRHSSAFWDVLLPAQAGYLRQSTGLQRVQRRPCCCSA